MNAMKHLFICCRNGWVTLPIILSPSPVQGMDCDSCLDKLTPCVSSAALSTDWKQMLWVALVARQERAWC